jgi:uncharacterized membrane protein YagU involved in acid resistance
MLRISCASSWFFCARIHVDIVLRLTECRSNIHKGKLLFRGHLFYQKLTVPYRLQYASLSNILLISYLLLSNEHTKRIISFSPVNGVIILRDNHLMLLPINRTPKRVTA